MSPNAAVMKTRCLFLLLICNVSFTQTGNKSFVYLQNQRTEKIKKINLKSTYELSYNVDSTEDNFYSYHSWQCFEPGKLRFKPDGIDFAFNAENYQFWKQSGELETTDNWANTYVYDTSAFFPYTSETSGYDIYLTRQTKAGRILFATGVGIVYASLVNAFFIAPLRGLNAGSFNGYSVSRLWQGEMYSGIGICIGLPIMFIFDRRDYYFQNPGKIWDTWKVVEL
jgi:hypothetical protein